MALSTCNVEMVDIWGRLAGYDVTSFDVTPICVCSVHVLGLSRTKANECNQEKPVAQTYPWHRTEESLE